MSVRAFGLHWHQLNQSRLCYGKEQAGTLCTPNRKNVLQALEGFFFFLMWHIGKLCFSTSSWLDLLVPFPRVCLPRACSPAPADLCFRAPRWPPGAASATATVRIIDLCHFQGCWKPDEALVYGVLILASLFPERTPSNKPRLHFWKNCQRTRACFQEAGAEWKTVLESRDVRLFHHH
jgi:hypothetical protein